MFLRNRRALEIGQQKGFRNMNYTEMVLNSKPSSKWIGNKDKLKDLVDQIKLEYPQKTFRSSII